MIGNRFRELLLGKSQRENRRIPVTEVSEKTGVHRSTLYAYDENSITRFDGHVLVALCKYFECQLCDLLVIQGESHD